MKSFNRRSLLVSSLGAGIAASALADDQCGERPNTAPALQPPLLLTDWPWLARYRDDNARIITSGVKVDTVFLGDSITEGWVQADAEFFSRGNVGRGISAQTTPQLLVRMHADVIALRPRCVHIMAGTNDIAHNTGPMTAQDSQNNLMAMCEIAQMRKMAIVLGSVPPASRYWWQPEARPKPEALALNDWMRGYAKQIGAKYADYAAVLTDNRGDVKPELAKDEVHPTTAGYAAMRAVAEAAIRP